MTRNRVGTQEEVISAFDDSRAEALEVQMYSVDVMRAKYLVRAYLKARHAKVTHRLSVSDIAIATEFRCGGAVIGRRGDGFRVQM